MTTDESASDHDVSLVSFMLNTSSCEREREDLREPGYEADHECSSDDYRGSSTHNLLIMCFVFCVNC